MTRSSVKGKGNDAAGDAMIASLQKQISQLKNQLRFTEIMNDASIDRVLAFDLDMRVIAWNKMCEMVWGVEKEEIMGRNLLQVFPIMNECPNIIKAIESAKKGFKSFVPSDKGSFDGSYSENHFIPLKDDDGKIVAVMNVIHDVAHRVKAENELKDLNQALDNKNKELNMRNEELRAFYHTTGHDLKDPLRKIYSFIEMIMNEEGQQLSPKGRSFFRRIQASTQRMSLLTDDILAFSQINHARGVTLTEVNLDHILKYVQNQLQDKILASNTVIESDELPAVEGYRHLLSLLFMNIISNAIKFQQPGNAPHIRITAQLVKRSEITPAGEQPAAAYVILSFKDNGIGIDTEDAEKIFRMFSKLHANNTYPGAGIGLAQCRKIMEMHHGYITVESKPGEGSTFICHLPVKQADTEE